MGYGGYDGHTAAVVRLPKYECRNCKYTVSPPVPPRCPQCQYSMDTKAVKEHAPVQYRENTKNRVGWTPVGKCLVGAILAVALSGCTFAHAVGHATAQAISGFVAPLPSGVWDTEPFPGCTRAIPLLHDPSDALPDEWFQACPTDIYVASQTYEPPLNKPPDSDGKRTRTTVWGPYPFTSVAYGDFDNPITSLERGPRVHAFQIYWGDAKKDGTLTAALRAGRLGGNPKYHTWTVYATTAGELSAIRERDIALVCQLDDPAGC